MVWYLLVGATLAFACWRAYRNKTAMQYVVLFMLVSLSWMIVVDKLIAKYKHLVDGRANRKWEALASKVSQ